MDLALKYSLVVVKWLYFAIGYNALIAVDSAQLVQKSVIITPELVE